VTDQVHRRTVDVQGPVHLQHLRPRGRARSVDHLDLGPELPRCAGLHRTGLELHVEPLHREPERHQVRLAEAGTRGEVVVLGQVVGEALSDDHHTGAAEPEEDAHRHPEQQEQQADVEDQVAGFPQVAALRGDGVLASDHPVALLPQQVRRPRQHSVAGRRPRRRVRREPGQVARRTWGLRPQRPGVHPDPGDDAADEGDEKQQVDRREPGRGVDLEQPDPVEQRPTVGCWVR
jgi:hypothetical protein